MKTLFPLIVLLSSSTALANGFIQLQSGSSATISPGETTTVSCNGGSAPTSRYYKCTLNWTSTDGDAMPTLHGEGDSHAEAISYITAGCRVQPGNGNAAKCAGLAGSATCTVQ